MASILAAGRDKSGAKRVYERLAPMYDFWAHLTEAKARRRCIELAAVRERGAAPADPGRAGPRSR